MSRRPARGTWNRSVGVVLAAALLLLAGACGDDGDVGGRQASGTEMSTPDGSTSTQPPASTQGTDVAEPVGATEIDDELLREAHETFAEQVRLFAPEAVGRPLAEFAEAVADACRAVADPAASTPDERAAAVADAIGDRDGLPGWQGVAIGVATQYFFMGGCDVPDRDAVLEALAPRITEGLGGD